jgi:hypothetical protein
VLAKTLETIFFFDSIVWYNGINGLGKQMGGDQDVFVLMVLLPLAA